MTSTLSITVCKTVLIHCYTYTNCAFIPVSSFKLHFYISRWVCSYATSTLLSRDENTLIERLHMTSQTLRNHFHVAKEVCQHTHSTRSVVGVDATKHLQLPISSEPTGSTMDQSCCTYNCTARVVGETQEGRNTVLSRS